MGRNRRKEKSGKGAPRNSEARGKSEVICYYCLKKGHTQRTCRQRIADKKMFKEEQGCNGLHSLGFRKISEPQEKLQAKQRKIVCFYCQRANLGTQPEQRPLRPSGNPKVQRKSNVVCYYCQKKGHLKRNCRQRIADDKRREDWERADEMCKVICFYETMLAEVMCWLQKF